MVFALAAALMPPRATLACFALASALQAQATTWQLPAHGAILFAEQGRMRGVRQDGRAVQPFDAIGDRCHPVLFADEFAGGGQRWLAAPWSLESIPVWLAADLEDASTPGSVIHVWPRISRFGEVTFLGRREALGADGWQRITGHLTRGPVRDRPGAIREVASDRSYMANELDVQLVVRRQFRADHQLQTIEWTITGTITGDHPPVPIEVSEGRTWRRTEVLDNHRTTPGGHDLAERVQEASERCRARLLREVVAQQGAIGAPPNRGSIHGPSLHAAMLHGLARTGMRAGDPQVDAALTALLERDPSQVHGRAFTILAIAGLHAPADDRELTLRGQAPRIPLPDAWRPVVTRQVEALLRERRPGTDGEPTWWPFAPDVDQRSLFHSSVCIQALDAAVRCGIAVPRQVFAAFARNLVATAVPFAGAAPAPRIHEPGLTVPRTTATNQAREQSGACCWTDSHLGAFGANGADTAWAMAALLACARHVDDPALRASCHAFAERGWAWLLHHHTARHCPAPMPVQRQYRHSYVHAMAWLLDESGVLRLGEHDLYFELAAVLLCDCDVDQVRSTVVDTTAALAFWRPLHGAPSLRSPAGR